MRQTDAVASLSGGHTGDAALPERPASPAHDYQWWELLWDLAELSKRQAEVVRLRHAVFPQSPWSIIGAALRISPSSARVHYARGLRKLHWLIRGREAE